MYIGMATSLDADECDGAKSYTFAVPSATRFGG
jgi:hypothetical protein